MRRDFLLGIVAGAMLCATMIYAGAARPQDLAPADAAKGSATAAESASAPASATSDDTLDWSLLNADPAPPAIDAPVKPLRAPKPPTAPGLDAIGARVEAKPDQGKLGTSLERSLPLGEDVSVTVKGGVTESFGAAPGAGDMPPAVAPSAAAAPRVLDSEKLVKLSILPTGTTFGAGITTSTSDPLSHRQLTAEQQLYGPLHVTGTVTDMGQSDVSKSITAGIKLNW